MAVISMDANDQADGRVARPRIPFQRRNTVASLHVANDKRPTEFGYHLLSEMAAVRLKPAQLARLADTSGSTITRLVYGGVSRPDSDTLAKLARALIQAGPAVDDFDKAVEDKHNGLLHAAGYRLGAAPPPVVLHPHVVELQQMIGEGSPLPPDVVQYLADMVDRLMAPHREAYRRKARRRSA